MVDNLRAVTKQSTRTIESEIDSERAHLLSMSSEIGKMLDQGESVDSIIETLSSMNNNSKFKRIGYVNDMGMAQTTDGYRINLSYREFFQRSMDGEFVLTSTLMDSIGTPEPINVFSAPVYLSDETICGVVFATYRSDDFRGFFDMNDFDSTGSYCIVNQKSEVIAATDTLPFDYSEMTLCEYLMSLDDESRSLVTDFYANVQELDDLDTYYVKINKIGGSYIYFEPIDMGSFGEPWFLISMVSEQTVADSVSVTMSTITIMLLEICLLVVAAFLLFLIDTERVEKKQRRELERIAFVDPLTGGDNYARFIERVQKQDKNGYIVSMDLHSFKMINSVCGTERGNEVLRLVCQWVSETVSRDDVVAHGSADRYMLFFPRNDRGEVAEKLTLINRKISYETKKANLPQVFAYFGITVYRSGEQVEEALSQANFARDSIHDRRDRFYTFFDQDTTNRIMQDKHIEDDFDEAMLNGEFEVWYQPKYSPETDEMVGAEALVRWKKPDGSLVSPGKFIPIYEANGMIRILDEYVFRETCKEQRRLMELGNPIFPISVNLSRASIYSVNLVEHYRQIADEIGVDPAFVPIEITESAAVDEKFIQTIAEEFYKKGFPLYMDDFGSGYSSLSSINRMHFDTLKLDKSLIDYIGNFGGEQLIKHIIALARDLGMHVTAEGVENIQQVEFLLAQNCDSIQGFYYSKPVPQEQFEAMAVREVSVA